MTVEYGPMAYLGENIDAALAAAAGDDPALFLELRAAFVESRAPAGPAFACAVRW
jgi:hypothetical protein